MEWSADERQDAYESALRPLLTPEFCATLRQAIKTSGWLVTNYILLGYFYAHIEEISGRSLEPLGDPYLLDPGDTE